MTDLINPEPTVFKDLHIADNYRMDHVGVVFLVFSVLFGILLEIHNEADNTRNTSETLVCIHSFIHSFIQLKFNYF